MGCAVAAVADVRHRAQQQTDNVPVGERPIAG